MLPERLDPVVHRACWKGRAVAPRRPTARARQMTFGFEPGDIVSEVMSFGSPTPIEIVVSSPDLSAARAHASKVLAELRQDSRPARRADPADAGLPDRADHHRPPEGRPERPRHQADRAVGAGDHLVEPHGRPQLLAGSQDGRQLSGAGAGADAAHGFARAGGDGAAGAGQRRAST